jgi:hypothetical protein
VSGKPDAGPDATAKVQELHMTYNATNYRNAFVAVAFAFVTSALLLAGTVAAPLVA